MEKSQHMFVFDCVVAVLLSFVVDLVVVVVVVVGVAATEDG